MPKIICKGKSLPKGLLEDPDLGYLKVQATHHFRNMLLLVPTVKAVSERQARCLYPSGFLQHATYLDEPNDTAVLNHMQYYKRLQASDGTAVEWEIAAPCDKDRRDSWRQMTPRGMFQKRMECK